MKTILNHERKFRLIYTSKKLKKIVWKKRARSKIKRCLNFYVANNSNVTESDRERERERAEIRKRLQYFFNAANIKT